MPIQQGATNQFKVGLADGGYNFLTDTFKIALYTGAANLGHAMRMIALVLLGVGN